MDNSNNLQRYYELAEKWKNNTITPEELAELESWYEEGQANRVDIPVSFAKSEDELSRRLFSRIKEKTGKEETPIRRLRRWPRVAAAIAILFVLGAGGFYLFTKKGTKESIAKANVPSVNDALPGEFKAKLILDDGRELILDSVAIGELARQGNARVVKGNGQVIYEGNSDEDSFKLLYNTIATANGQTYSLTLSDGSKVWLNAHSSIRFPVIFGNDERKVEITGEAYFEVAKDASKQFVISANGTETAVLGTHFNINCYEDEASVKISLLEGKIMVNKSVIMKPGQQAQIMNNSISMVNDADMDQAIAWKNGLFNFERSDLKAVMRQLSRWYDVDIQYSGNIPNEHFSGKISRNMNASKVLKVLEYSGVQFKIEDKKIVVYP